MTVGEQVRQELLPDCRRHECRPLECSGAIVTSGPTAGYAVSFLSLNDSAWNIDFRISYLCNMSQVIAYPDNKEKLVALKAFMKALKISFEEKDAGQYNPEFVSKIMKGDNDLKEGKGVKIDTDDLWK